MFNRFSKVLIIAPHTDDAEFGYGGTISRLIDKSIDLYIATFFACEQSVPRKYPSYMLIM
jgi:LmbE family N-acetylglucosaminyl deacetylase